MSHSRARRGAGVEVGLTKRRTSHKDHPLSKPTTSEYIRGSLYGLAAVSIWASWIVAVRLGLRTSLTPWDIMAIRFGVAGLILLPYLLKKGLAVDRLGGAGLAAIMLGGGAPMVLVSYGGLLFAPAAHAASLYTALIPLYVAILAVVVLGEAFTVAKRIGLVLIVTGVLGIVWGAGGTIGSRQNIGHAMFISAGMLWACYVVAMRKARLGGLHAAAIAAVGSLITYVPVYAIIFGTSLFNAPWRDLALQAFVHGSSGGRDFVLVYRTRGQHSWRVKRLSVRGLGPRDNRDPGHSDSRRMASDE